MRGRLRGASRGVQEGCNGKKPPEPLEPSELSQPAQPQRPLHFSSTDIANCYDNIDQSRLFDAAQDGISLHCP